jgi:hypothetical protein
MEAKLYHPVLRKTPTQFKAAAERIYAQNKANLVGLSQAHVQSPALRDLGIPESAAFGNTATATLYIGFALGQLLHDVDMPLWVEEKAMPVEVPPEEELPRTDKQRALAALYREFDGDIPYGNLADAGKSFGFRKPFGSGRPSAAELTAFLSEEA